MFHFDTDSTNLYNIVNCAKTKYNKHYQFETLYFQILFLHKYAHDYYENFL